MKALKSEPDYVAFGTGGGPDGWLHLRSLGPGTACTTTIREDGTGFTTLEDGSVIHLTEDEVLESFGAVAVPTEGGLVIAADPIIIGSTGEGRTASIEDTLANRCET